MTRARISKIFRLLFLNPDDTKLPIPEDINIPLKTAEAAVTGLPK